MNLDYEKNAEGLYSYLLAAYRLKDEEFWHVGVYPVPFEKVVPILEARGIDAQEVCLVCDGG
jgi:hypothetical protein